MLAETHVHSGNFRDAKIATNKYLFKTRAQILMHIHTDYHYIMASGDAVVVPKNYVEARFEFEIRAAGFGLGRRKSGRKLTRL